MNKKSLRLLLVVLGGALLVGCAALLRQPQAPTDVGAPPVPLPDQTPLGTPGQALIQPVYPTPTPESIVLPPQPTKPMQQATQIAAPPLSAPAQTAEEVVEAFLKAYTQDPQQMTLYLSQNCLANLPAGGAAAVAQLNGNLDGFVIQSGSVALNPPYAVVVVALNLNGGQTVRVFQLVQENGQWKIEMVDIARG